jgi:hypothetical protein
MFKGLFFDSHECNLKMLIEIRVFNSEFVYFLIKNMSDPIQAKLMKTQNFLNEYKYVINRTSLPVYSLNFPKRMLLSNSFNLFSGGLPYKPLFPISTNSLFEELDYWPYKYCIVHPEEKIFFSFDMKMTTLDLDPRSVLHIQFSCISHFYPNINSMESFSLNFVGPLPREIIGGKIKVDRFSSFFDDLERVLTNDDLDFFQNNFDLFWKDLLTGNININDGKIIIRKKVNDYDLLIQDPEIDYLENKLLLLEKEGRLDLESLNNLIIKGKVITLN